MWKSLETWGREVPGSLMGPLDRCLDQNAERNADGKDNAHEGTDRNNDSIRNGNRGHFCSIRAKNLATFYECLESVGDTECENNGLNGLVEEIFKTVSHSGCSTAITCCF